MPKFLGGEKAMYKYIAENIKYPEKAKKDGIEGRVFVSFIVEKDGSVSEVELLRGIGSGCDEAALDVIRNMPQWNPGKQHGQPVRVQYRMPVKFSL
jgi:protein TonB